MTIDVQQEQAYDMIRGEAIPPEGTYNNKYAFGSLGVCKPQLPRFTPQELKLLVARGSITRSPDTKGFFK